MPHATERCFAWSKGNQWTCALRRYSPKHTPIAVYITPPAGYRRALLRIGPHALNAAAPRCCYTSHGWRAIAQRAPNGDDWEAAIEPLDGGARIASAVVFRSSDVARE